MAALPVGLAPGSARQRRQASHLRLVPPLPPALPPAAREPVTRRRRSPVAKLLPGLLVIGAIAATWFGTGALASSRPAPAAGAPVPGATLTAGQRYVVRPGDTLWAIALRLDPAGDPRPLVAALGSELHGSQLQPGQVLVMP